MTTTSMHKPGWRSRRRSRLSLVERAVPRLGRLPAPENGAKPACSAKAMPDMAKTPRAGFEAEPSPRSAEDDQRFDTVQQDQPQAAPDTAASEAASKLPVDDAGDRIEKHEAVEAASAPPAEDEPEADGASDDPPVAEDTPALSAETPVVTATFADEALPAASGADTRIVLAPLHPAPAKPQPATAPEAAFGRPEARPAAPTGPILALDWDRLIESGFTDPRDRARPLPPNMDPIIRSLIRQALSDQSSWRDRIILVTSPIERIGKTTAAINFAFGLTTVANHRAVLVDVDTSGPGAVDRLGGKGRIGLTDGLTDDDLAIDDLVIRTDLDRLTLVGSGAHDEDILDQFASRRMLQILRHLTKAPESILVIDAPPILVSQEAAVLNVIAGQVVMAVEAGRTTADQIEHALQRLGERHNVSLVLHESSGAVQSDVTRAERRQASAKALKPAPMPKRRLPRAAAMAGALALGLIAVHTLAGSGQAYGAGMAMSESSSISMEDGASKSERWSILPATVPAPCQRICR